MLQAWHEPVPPRSLDPDTVASAAGVFSASVKLAAKTSHSPPVTDSDECVKSRAGCIENTEDFLISIKRLRLTQRMTQCCELTGELLLMGRSGDTDVLGGRSSSAEALGHRTAWLETEPEAIRVAHGVIDRARTGGRLEVRQG